MAKSSPPKRSVPSPAAENFSRKAVSRLVTGAWVLSLVALGLANLIYPLSLSESAVGKLAGFLALDPKIFSWLLAFLRFEFSPLTLKESVAGGALVVALACWATGWIGGLWPRPRLTRGLAVALLFLGWCLVSAFYASHRFVDSEWNDQLFTVAVWGLLAFGLLLAPRTERLERWGVWSIVGTGVILLLVSAAQATRPFSGWIFTFMNRYEGPYQRNLYGALIGHNTGLAVACLPAFFFLLGGLIQARDWKSRALTGAGLALALYVLVVTKSRFVWVALPVLCGGFAVGLRSLTGLRISLRRAVWVGTLACLAAGGMLLPKLLNPAETDRTDFVARIQSFKPSVLIQGTRLRILTVSGGLVAQKPILGHGLGSFPMVYPAAQARYFHDHPETRLRPTDSIADHAHNEYLQILIEMGIVGLGLALCALFLFLREGLQRLRALDDPAVRMRRACALFGLLSILLHGFVDFPFHIVPIATVFLFCAALFFGPITVLDASKTIASSPAGEKNPTGSLRLAMVARLTAILFVWASLVPAGYYLVKRLRADAFAKRGSNLLASQAFEEARIALGESLILSPGQYQTLVELAECEFNLAVDSLRQATRERQNNKSQQAFEILHQGTDLLQSASDRLRDASRMAHFEPLWPALKTEDAELGPRHNHLTYHRLAKVSSVSQTLDPKNTVARQKALAYREQSVRYNPGSSDFVFDWLDRLDAARAEEKPLRREAFILLDRYNRELLLREMEQQANVALETEKPGQIIPYLTEALEAVPNSSVGFPIYSLLTRIRLAADDLEGFRRDLETVHRLYPENPDVVLLDFILAVRQKTYDRAVELMQPLLETRLRGDEFWSLAFAEALWATGRVTEGAALEREILRASSQPGHALMLLADARRYIFADPAGANRACQDALVYYPARLSTPQCASLLRDLAVRQDGPAVRLTLRFIREGFDFSDTLSALRATLQRQLAPNSGAPPLQPVKAVK